MRRYDVDSIRIIALILLIFYHISISFQTWALQISFIKNDDTLEFIWVFMMLINIWRIPILFIVSGMGIYFAMERRNWKELLDDRTLRIITPLIFGSIFIFPICPIIFNIYYKKPIFYFPFPGHLWFLINIYFYVLIFLPIFNYLKNLFYLFFFFSFLSFLFSFRESFDFFITLESLNDLPLYLLDIRLGNIFWIWHTYFVITSIYIVNFTSYTTSKIT